MPGKEGRRCSDEWSHYSKTCIFHFIASAPRTRQQNNISIYHKKTKQTECEYTLFVFETIIADGRR